MNAKEAKRLSKIEKDLLKKFRMAEKEEAKKLGCVEKEILQDESDSEEPIPIKHVTPEKLTTSTAQKLANLQKKLDAEFTTQYRRDIEETKQREKKYEPITKAIKEKNEEVSKEMVPMKLFTSTPRAIRFEDEEFSEVESFDDSSPLGLPSTPERDSFRQNKSLKQLMDTKTVRLGLIAARYFPRANDKQFGIYYDEDADKVKIGTESITFENDDIILINQEKKYKGTEGLWRLLTKNDYFDKEDMYTDDDWEAYKDILLRTNSLYRNNDPSTGKPKASRGRKYKGMIKQIWEGITGSGLATYNENPIEYKYVSNLNELIRRLSYIQAQETAGNNNFHNEKLALAKFLGDRLEELIETPKGIKYLVRCLSVLPESMIEGKGVLNDIINNLPFELHWPGYSYMGPGTKLDKRLKRGDKGINKLDEAAKEHDIWYRDHRNAEDRWVADKELQKKAWERVISADADLLEERIPALVATGAMWAKRKLGLGLTTSGNVYPNEIFSLYNKEDE